MSSQETSLSQRSEIRTTRPSSEIEFEAAKQLLQHSRRGREGNGDTMALVAEQTTLPDFATNFGSSGEEQRHDGEQLELGQEEHDNSQNRQADANYALISNSPGLGQVCR